MDTRILNRRASENETIIQKQFEKANYMVERLDFQGPRPRPDLLISDSSGPRMICEVKTVFSAGYLTERDAHVSTRDSKLWDSGVFENQINLTRINDCLGDAVRKRTAFVADRPEVKDLPLIVAFFFDFFADFLSFYPRDFGEHFRDVSGILTIESDVARTSAFSKLNAEEQEARLRTGIMSGLPSNSKDFVLVRNKTARRRIPKDFQLLCLTEPYDQSV